MQRWKTAFRWVRRCSLVGFAVVAVAVGAGWFWERSQRAAFVEAGFTPAGRLVGAAGRELHVVSSGEGPPGVLLISGAGEDLRTWHDLQPRLAEITRVVSYDRPGLGWSSDRADAPTIDSAIEDIQTLLARPELFDAAPILVGHSLGGVIARQFAYRHPTQISGLVLLDAPPDKWPRLASTVEGTRIKLMSLLAAVGIMRWRFYADRPELRGDEALRQAHPSLRAWNGARRELVLVLNGEPFEPPPNGLDSLPLIVFVANWEAPPMLRGMLDEMNASKRLVAGESQRGRLIEVRSGHYIHQEDPDTVVAEIAAMLDAAASDRPANPENGEYY